MSGPVCLSVQRVGFLLHHYMRLIGSENISDGWTAVMGSPTVFEQSLFIFFFYSSLQTCLRVPTRAVAGSAAV